MSKHRAHPARVVGGAEAARSLIGDMSAVYGESGAQIISAGLIQGARRGLSELPFVRQPNITLNIGILTGDQLGLVDKRVFADWTRDRILLAFNADACPDEIAIGMPDAMVHELAHIAHHQQNPERHNRWTPFSIAITEGIAVYAVGNILADVVDYEENIDPFGYSREVIRSELVRILEGAYDTASPYDFLLENAELPGIAYSVGHYVVSLAAFDRELDLRQLMQMPIADFEAFARTELI